MEKKKIGIFAIILFLLIGLGSFVFANPDSEKEYQKGGEVETVEDGSSKKDSKEKETEKTDDSKKLETVQDSHDYLEVVNRYDDNYQLNITTPNNNENNQSENNGSQVKPVDDSYKKALEAVKKVEQSFNENDLASAEKLVSDVKDENKKEELTNRLNDVKDAIDVEKLVAILEEKVDNAKNLTDMNRSRDYRDTSDVVNLVNNLKNSSKKEELIDRLEVLSSILDDMDKPVIEGITDGAYTNHNVKLNIKDANEVTKTVTFNGQTIPFEDEFKEEGTYVVVVTDAAYNEAKVTFTIDKTAPSMVVGDKEYKAGYDEIIYSSTRFKAEAKDFNGIEAIYANGHKRDRIDVNGEGKYTFKLVDIAGNESVFTVVVDKTAPKFVGLKNGTFYQNDIMVSVDDANLDKITARIDAEGKVVEIENNTLLTTESIYLLTATDKAGNKAAIYVAVDKTNPEFVGLKNGHQYNKDMKVDVKDLKVKTIELYSYYEDTTKKIENGYILSEEGKYKLTATDYSGRITSIFVIIDKTAPSMVVGDKEYKAGYDEIIYSSTRFKAEAKDFNGIKAIYANGHKRDRIDVNGEGKYTFKLVDRAGNESVFTVVVDKTKPVFKGIKNGIYYQDDITVSVDDANLDKITAKVYADAKVVEIENNTTLTKESIYFLTATDKAGNKESIYVAVDKTNPEFVGLMNGHQYNKDMKVDVKDLKVKTIELYSYYEDTTKTIENGYILGEEGKYKLTATDYSGRITSIYVIIDKTAPSMVVGDKEYKAGYDEIIYSSTRFKAEAKDFNGIKAIYANGHKRDRIDVNGEGKYTFKLVDIAGNESVFTVVVDKTAPEFVGLMNGHQYNQNIKVNVKDVALDNISVYSYETNETFEIENGEELTTEGTYLLTATDKLGRKTSIYVTIDKTAPKLVVDTIENGVSNSENPQIHATDLHRFNIVVKLNGKVVREESAKLNQNGLYSVWFGIGYMEDGNYEVEVKDQAGNVDTINFVLNRVKKAQLVAAKVGSNKIDEAKNTINNFNSFAIKFDQDLTFAPFSSNQKYMIEMEYSTDGVHYTKSNYIVDNWGSTLVDKSGNKYGSTSDPYTIKANSSIYWSGRNVGSRWTDIYNAILNTKDTDNKVYVRTIFTIVQPDYTESFTLDDVVYSKGGTEVTPAGLPTLD